MQRSSFLAALATMLLSSACSDPRCPRNMVQDGMMCWRCPEGSVVRRNQCFAPDAGLFVDPVEPDEDAEVNVPLDDSAVAAPDDRLDAETAPLEQGSDGAASDGEPDASDAGGNASGGGEGGASDAGSGMDDASTDAGPPCYADKDKDGVGAGAPVSCATLGSDAGTPVSLRNDDCDDDDAQRSPRLTDICGDRIDNDCDGTPDDEANNACGGPCTAQLAHQPGEACSNGLRGACARSGTYQCQGTSATVCNAPSVAAGAEVCGDGVDNDCDGNVDEADAIDARTWYRDCDGDGYATSASTIACSQPAATTSCRAWLPARPQAGVNEDCDDYNGSYTPGIQNYAYPVAPNTSFDMDCDGTVEFEPLVRWPSSNPLLSNVGYVCATGLSCADCWRAACGNNPTFFTCYGAQPIGERKCSRAELDQRARIATPDCTSWMELSVSQACR